MKTQALFFPFDLFGSPGTRVGAELLADAVRELLADNRREKVPTRARAYAGKVRVEELLLETLADYRDWRATARAAVEEVFDRREFLLYATGNHLGVLPIYDALAGTPTLVVQLDAHLDVYHLSDCTSELSHGNFLLHCDGPLPPIVNLGHRELLLKPDHIAKGFRHAFAASALHVDPEPALAQLRTQCGEAERIFLDIDCDVFDAAYFPAVGQAAPFGLSPALLLRILDAAWSERVAGLALSEFHPAHDDRDRSLATLLWLIEYVLLRRYESGDS